MRLNKKKFLLIILSAILVAAIFYNKVMYQSLITYTSSTYDFGKMKEGEKRKWIFVFTNTGSDNLILNDYEASCGCTLVELEKQEYRPGETGNIVLIFDSSDKIGKNILNVILYSNAKNNPVTLTLYADVAEDLTKIRNSSNL